MSAVPKWNLVSVEDYLRGELHSPIKHEYLGGVVHAMAGARNLHNLIASNIVVAVGGRLRGKKCRVYNSDTKIRIRLRDQIRFYYPDVPIICQSNPSHASFQDEPVVLFEVLLQATRRIDEGEKRDAYLTIQSLKVYVLIDQEAACAVVYRRDSASFSREVHTELDAIVPLGEIETVLPLAEVYDGVEFQPEADPEEP